MLKFKIGAVIFLLLGLVSTLFIVFFGDDGRGSYIATIVSLLVTLASIAAKLSIDLKNEMDRTFVSPKRANNIFRKLIDEKLNIQGNDAVAIIMGENFTKLKSKSSYKNLEHEIGNERILKIEIRKKNEAFISPGYEKQSNTNKFNLAISNIELNKLNIEENYHVWIIDDITIGSDVIKAARELLEGYRSEKSAKFTIHTASIISCNCCECKRELDKAALYYNNLDPDFGSKWK